MLVAQITDFHISTPEGEPERRFGTAGFLRRAVAHLNSLTPAPAAVLATGDLVHEGSAEEYALLEALLAPLAMPVYLIPGNHDAREPLRAAFLDDGYLPVEGFLNYTIEDLPLRLVALDTHQPGEVGGLLCEERLTWLSARLAEQSERPTLIFMHHPPFATGIARMDLWGLENAGALGAVIARHGQVERIVCGHLHRPISTRWHGTVVSTCPSTAHQFALDVSGNPDRLDVIMEPPACQLHLWRPEAGLVTHTSYIGDYGEPRPAS